MAAEELAQATRRWRWWSGAARHEEELQDQSRARFAYGTSRFESIPCGVALCPLYVHFCSRSMFQRSRDESSYRFDIDI
eukprot:359419-Prymnesium_polylepis.2